MKFIANIFIIVFSVFIVACSDNDPPAWTPETKLLVSTIDKGAIQLRWKSALDARGVVGYSIKQGATSLGEVDSGTLQLLVNELTDLTEYNFTITAKDKAGNVSAPLAATFTTPDWTPPTWEDDYKLGVILKDLDNAASGVVISWDKAADNDEVAQYTVSRNGKILGTLPGNVGAFHVTSTPFNGLYVVGACDRAGNCAVTPAKAVDTSVLRRVAVMSSILADVIAENNKATGSSGLSVGDLFKDTGGSSDIDLSEVLKANNKLNDLNLAEKMGLDKLGADMSLLKSGSLRGLNFEPKALNAKENTDELITGF